MQCPYCKKVFPLFYKNKGSSYWGNGQRYNFRAPIANFNRHVNACKKTPKEQRNNFLDRAISGADTELRRMEKSLMPTDKIRSHLNNRTQSLQVIADKSGLTKQTVISVLHGRNKPTVTTVNKLKRFFKLRS
jgi:antitoxin component HigA of HigAB toxin-antitoxin module